MDFKPINNLFNLCRQEAQSHPARETTAEKIQKFAEESTFFFSATFFFKNRSVRIMHGTSLMSVLEKDKTRKKKRTVTRKKASQEPYLSGNGPQQERCRKSESTP